MSVNKHVARSEATRAKLVGAARALFGARGFAAVGTEEVVKAAGVTRGALYHQFKDKHELFEAVVIELEEDTTRRIAEGVIATASSPLEALRAGARAFLDICEEPEVERILLLDAPGVLGWERWREIGQQYGLGVIRASLTAAMEAGEIPRSAVEPLSHVLLGALDEGALYVARAADREQAREDILALLERMLG